MMMRAGEQFAVVRSTEMVIKKNSLSSSDDAMVTVHPRKADARDAEPAFLVLEPRFKAPTPWRKIFAPFVFGGGMGSGPSLQPAASSHQAGYPTDAPVFRVDTNPSA